MNMQQEVLGFLRIDWHDVSPPRSEVGTKSVILGCTLYVTPYMACQQCAAVIVQSGIAQIV
jgi:tRNA(Arg) A34 adenosine deaminase TadA